MLVLAIDTALEACSAAVFDSEQSAVVAGDTEIMTRGHAEALMPLVDRVMSDARVDFFALDRIAVTVGPGSFTGLRVGIAAARGIGLAARKPVVGITTLAALAAPYIAADPNTPVAAAIDGRHCHVYFQLFGAQGRVLVPPRIIPVEDAVHLADGASARLVGSGAGMMTQIWPDPMNLPPIDERGAPDIVSVARLGADAEVRDAPPKPLYLRPPDAHPQTAAILPRR
ncbi:tRNA (adenosine(37)-N6)-threonylcarbamoyltransferase complex dimerization subunit type 1 TsaB [Pseudorhodoplanes sp.]|jgi:tRNA threonylcarbamoyladenosine biosynthesis protein TsaB|uniref:tRNA (adenosine(37)-N6)-threonylcarbamoyltransferase complex dimerization subunit type 1 TsaB n=1 Tax=Pseudorhodoplanes sp. TaxID=1934341 RepID=UPI002B604185|nr:tRNA (adenosine(37)-N6)-threonylcarbamoyltransferase complex dimerization subunit type 1 TsaB [Pseudorhodoplanes sp.]HWV43882.1 tRNA (adenosine(37)-N6)-threonylcarbamoyltransferase complex dimerization subunit type 1 TsaB [Pseudorhodoplanes sp.]